jgi:phospholipid/cholesterol/gamma-HCH transport system substrate-binding protein
MSAPANHWKLGAFVLGSVLVGLTAVVALAARTLQIETVTYTSYFDEGVSGLEVGSPVSFRGVKIGNVSSIDVAADRRHVEVNYSLGVRVLGRLGLASGGQHKETKIVVPSDLRVQIASTGLTGTKFILLDFFDPETPPEELPFPLPENYIPATPSTMKNLEDAVVRAVNALPELTASIGKVMDKVNLLLADLDQKGLPSHAKETLVQASQLMRTLQGKLDQVQVAELSRDTSAVLKSANVALVRVNKLLDRLDGEQGLLSSVQRTSDSLGDLAGSGLGDNVNSTARDLREAASAIRDFLEALERDPDMLLKGKAKKP